MPCKTIALTGISSDHYDEVQDAIVSIQNFHPDMKILVYDLGLKPCEIYHLSSLHNVEVISSPFKLHPNYVRHLQATHGEFLESMQFYKKGRLYFGWMQVYVCTGQ